MENKKRNELIKRITRDINKLDTVTLGRINAFTMGIMGDKAMEFEQKQDVEGMDGSMVYTKCLVDGNEERVEFDGTVYMVCKECGEEISMDIRELISHETASEDFTEFKGFTCHDCIQKEGQAVESISRNMTVAGVMDLICDELKSISVGNKEIILSLLSDALDTEDEEGQYIKLEKVAGYARALEDNCLMDDAEHDILSVAIEEAQNWGE